MELEKREYQIIQAAAAAAQAESLQQVAEARALLKMKCVRRKRDAHVAASNTRRKLGTQGTQNGASNYNDDGLDKIAHLEISARRDMFSGLPEEETVKIFRNKFKPTNLYRLKLDMGLLAHSSTEEEQQRTLRAGGAETPIHLLAKCQKWRVERRSGFIEQSFYTNANQKKSLGKDGKSGQKRGGWQSY